MCMVIVCFIQYVQSEPIGTCKRHVGSSLANTDQKKSRVCVVLSNKVRENSHLQEEMAAGGPRSLSQNHCSSAV